MQLNSHIHLIVSSCQLIIPSHFTLKVILESFHFKNFNSNIVLVLRPSMIIWSAVFSLQSCSCVSLPITSASSIWHMQGVLCRMDDVLVIGKEDIGHSFLKMLRGDSKSSLLKQYWLWGVIKVVSSLDLCASGICQKQLLASSLLNTLAPVNWASVSSTLGRGWSSLNTLSLLDFRSKHNLMEQFFLLQLTLFLLSGNPNKLDPTLVVLWTCCCKWEIPQIVLWHWVVDVMV